jgi:hypothetical protein
MKSKNVNRKSTKLNICKEDKKCLMRIRKEHDFKSLNTALSFCIQETFNK